MTGRGKDGFMDGFFFGPTTEAYAKMQQGLEGRNEAVQDKTRRRKREADEQRRVDSARKRKQKGMYEKRAKRRKLFLDLAQKAWYKHENELKFQEQIAFERKVVSSAILKQQAIARATGEHTRLDANPAVLSQASTKLAQSYVFFKIPSARVNTRVGK